MPAGARIEVNEGQKVQAGQLLAHQPRATGGTQDITGGLPRVTEVFEARKPKDPAAMAEISGQVELRSDKRKGKMTITIRSESGMEKEHHVPRDRHLNVHTGDFAEARKPSASGECDLPIALRRSATISKASSHSICVQWFFVFLSG